MDSPEIRPLPDETSQGWVSDLYIDAEGEWYHNGNRLTRDDIVEFFLEHLEQDAEGRFLIHWKDQQHLLRVEDTPFVIARVDKIVEEETGKEQVLLSCRHVSSVEVLDPLSLKVGSDNVMYCRVRNGRFPARFSRPAYYQLAEWIEETEEPEGFCLRLNDRAYPIPQEDAP